VTVFTDESALDKAKKWITQGATPTETVAAILKNAGVLQGA
jgi:ribosomal protein S16